MNSFKSYKQLDHTMHSHEVIVVNPKASLGLNVIKSGTRSWEAANNTTEAF